MKAALKEFKNNFDEEYAEERYFKLINIGEKMKFCAQHIDSRSIEFTSSVLTITCLKLINTIEGISFEGQRLSGKKLIICGYIDARFFINKAESKFYIKRNIPFSTFIVVPKNIKDDEIVYLDYSIEDVTIVNAGCDYVFIAVTLFLEYKPEGTALEKL